MYLQSPPPKREREPDPGPLALRAATLAVIAAVMFGVLVFRLWALQVLHSDHYVAQANQNTVHEFHIPAPRGLIFDRAGRVLVDNVSGVAVQVNPASLPRGLDCTAVQPQRQPACEAAVAQATPGSDPACRDFPWQDSCRVLDRLAQVLGMKPHQVWQKYQAGITANPGQPVTIDTVGVHQIAFVKERASKFPGVQFEETSQRSYPFGPVAAGVLGYVGRIYKTDLKDPNFKGLPNDATVGHAGVEYTYDQYLRGADGLLDQNFDASGNPVGQGYMSQAPSPGDSLRLSIDARLQQVAQQAIAYGIQVAHADGETGASSGAVVAMNPQTGEIYALASYPTYNPSIYVPPYRGLGWATSPKNTDRPLVDRALAGVYPPGSTFKPFTASASWQSGLIGPGSQLLCSGTYQAPNDFSHTVFSNWDTSVNRMIDLPTALEISCDSFFYRLGNSFWSRGEAFQSWLRRFGFGVTPQIDIGGAVTGLVPDRVWKESYFSDPVSQSWNPGDDINMAIGQGFLTVTPLQLAVAYSALANGGKLVSPHVAQTLVDAKNNPMPDKRLRFPPPRSLRLSPALLAQIRQGLVQASHSALGTSSAVFGGFSPCVAGKTGTAEVPPNDPNAWYASWAPCDNPQLVVVALIANGGHGGVSAAPAALRVYQAFFHPKQGLPTIVGTDNSH
jgi:penicillin-binding protein 2